MAERETTRICTYIIGDHFGDVAAAIAAELLKQGRIPLSRIVRTTGLKSQRVANALLTLIQHNIIWHYTPDGGQTVYSIDVEEVLGRIRYGQYLAIAEETFDSSAIKIISLLMDHGRIKAGDIIKRLAPDANDHKGESDFLEAENNFPTLLTQHFHDSTGKKKGSESLLILVQGRYLKATDIALQASPQDRFLRFEKEAHTSVRNAPGAKKGIASAKELLEIKEIATKKLNEETARIESSALIKGEEPMTLTSKAKGKAKAPEEDRVDLSVYVRINPQKFNIHIRNQIFAASASARYNPHASTVLLGVLRASLPDEYSPHSHPRSEPISYHAIPRHFPPSTPELSGLVIPKSVLEAQGILSTSSSRTQSPSGSVSTNGSERKSKSKGKDKGRDKEKEEERLALRNLLVREWVDVLCAADNLSVGGRQSAFMSLTMGGGGPGEGVGGGKSSRRVQVEYDLIGKRLRQEVLDNLVRDKWGVCGIRIINVLRDCGKLDSEQIAKRAMLKKVDVQKYLKDMSTESIVSSFEMARGTDRQASRSIYLWFIDTPRTYSSLLYSLYRTQSNILVRIRTEREHVLPLLEKQLRTDVQANPEEFMPRHERQLLEEYVERRDKLTVLLARVDEGVFVLRDLARDGYAGDDPYFPLDLMMK
ncbi:hypothetical protein DL93DRAFT_2172096 [Clavulina sp. PMI_390]|nr:hypothetical protein DL93DRAFT_2172096 [Clavulina sp. PMI_390]